GGCDWSLARQERAIRVPAGRGRAGRPSGRPQECRAGQAAERTGHRGCLVTVFEKQTPPGPVAAPGGYRKGSVLADWLSTTDHKVIGHLYLITSFGFFMIAGLMAMIMRAQLMSPDNHLVSDQQYNELFTMHGAIMLLLFATPLFVGLANEIMPLQIGAPDVAFPRMNL